MEGIIRITDPADLQKIKDKGSLVIYLRKSSEGESQQHNSLKTQKGICLDYVQKNNLKCKYIVEESKSAYRQGERALYSGIIGMLKNSRISGNCCKECG
jgi:DNA invertase Pin-like site-specific DNA recombinase